MIYIGVKNNFRQAFSITSLGREDISVNAHWGPGIRDGYIFHYVLDGKGYFNGDPVHKGQGFFIESQKLHEYHSDQTEPWQYFWLILRGDRTAIKNCLADAGIPLQHHIFDLTFYPQLLRFTEQIFDQGSTTVSATQAFAWFYTLLALHQSQQQKTSKISEPQIHVQDAIRYMENNYHTDIRITDIAQHICVDDQYLYNLFTERLGISPKQFLNKLRIDRACYLLQKTSLSVSEIGDSVGYRDSLAFSAFFKRHMGVAPQVYRMKTNSACRVPNDGI